MCLTFSNAVTIAQMPLNMIQRFGESYILLTEYATETPYGWCIPWAQNDYRATKELRLGGNLPFLVDKFTGELSRVPLSPRFQVWLEEYARKHGY